MRLLEISIVVQFCLIFQHIVFLHAGENLHKAFNIRFDGYRNFLCSIAIDFIDKRLPFHITDGILLYYKRFGVGARYDDSIKRITGKNFLRRIIQPDQRIDNRPPKAG